MEEGKIRYYGTATWDGYRAAGQARSRAPGRDREPRKPARSIISASCSFPSTWGWSEAFQRREARERAGAAAQAGDHGGGERVAAAGAADEGPAGSAGGEVARASRPTRSAPFSSRARLRASRWRWSGMSSVGARHGESRRGHGAAGHAPSSTSGFSRNDGDRGPGRSGRPRRRARADAEPSGRIPALAEGRRSLPRATALLRRRLLRLLKERDKPGRLLNLRHTVRRIEYHLTGSAFESSVRMYELARRHFPKTYLGHPQAAHAAVRQDRPQQSVPADAGDDAPEPRAGGLLRPVPRALHRRVVRIADARPVPDAPLPGGSGAVARSIRAASTARWGCACVPARRWWDRRSTGTRWIGWSSFCEPMAARCWNRSQKARDRFSDEMMFEEAARQHKRLEKDPGGAETARRTGARHRPSARSRDYGVARAERSGIVVRARGALAGSAAIQLRDRRRQTGVARPQVAGACSSVRTRRATGRAPLRERQEYLALLARWYYSSWRDGEWIFVDRFEDMPYRRLVHAISRVAKS